MRLWLYYVVAGLRRITDWFKNNVSQFVKVCIVSSLLLFMICILSFIILSLFHLFIYIIYHLSFYHFIIYLFVIFILLLFMIVYDNTKAILLYELGERITWDEGLTPQTHWSTLFTVAVVIPKCTSRNRRPFTSISRAMPSVLSSTRGSNMTLVAVFIELDFRYLDSYNVNRRISHYWSKHYKSMYELSTLRLSKQYAAFVTDTTIISKQVVGIPATTLCLTATVFGPFSVRQSNKAC